MKIVIIGATGLIGQQLVNSLNDSGHSVTIVSRNNNKATKIFPSHSGFANWNGRNPNALVGIVNGSDAVINLAGESIAGGRWTNSRKQLILDSRIRSVKAVTEAINQAENKPKVLVQASAIGYYGTHPEVIFTEDSGSGNGFLSEVTQHWENALRGLSEEVRLIVIRTGVVLSEKGGALKKMQTPFKLGIGGPVGSGRQWLSWIHLEDEVRAITYLINKKGASGIYNLTAPQPVTMKEFAKTLATILQRWSWLKVPSFAVRMLFGQMGIETILRGQRVMPARLLAEGFVFRFSNLQDALKDIYRKN